MCRLYVHHGAGRLHFPCQDVDTASHSRATVLLASKINYSHACRVQIVSVR